MFWMGGDFNLPDIDWTHSELVSGLTPFQAIGGHGDGCSD